MKNVKIIFVSILVGLISSCGVKTQVDHLDALRLCVFKVNKIDSVYIARTPIEKLFNRNGFNMSQVPRVAFSMLSQNVPFKARLEMEISNPGTEDAGINDFEYILNVGSFELLKGVYKHSILVPANGGTVSVPFNIDKDIYPVLSNPDNQKTISAFFSSSKDTSVTLTLKIKPNIVIADKKISYPGYIDIEKRVSNRELLPYLK